jgi:hypothetical protein
MNTFPHFLVVALTLASPIFSGATQADGEVHFSPNGDCTETIVSEFGKAKKTVYVQAYSFPLHSSQRRSSMLASEVFTYR